MIDTHLHMLDFLQKSSGTKSIMEAMDGCGVEKAVLIGMPCCKKWSKDEPERPLYYQDDNGQCYFYSCESISPALPYRHLPHLSHLSHAAVFSQSQQVLFLI